MKKALLFLLATVLLLTFCTGCNDRTPEQPPESVDEWSLSPEDMVYVCGDGIWLKNTDQLPLTAGDIRSTLQYTQKYKYQDILNIIESDSITLTPVSLDDWSTCQYEVVSVISADEYWNALLNNNPQQPILILFAYQYSTGDVYVVVKDRAYLAGNPDKVRELLLPFLGNFYADEKIHWVNREYFIRYDIPGCEGSYYCHMYDFRYEKYWCIDREWPDNYFSELEGYPAEGANDLREALRLVAESLGYEQFAAFLGYDELTGYWEVGIDESDSLYSAKVYFDENFKILYGMTWGPVTEEAPSDATTQ